MIKNQTDLPFFGKLPPQAINEESVILGALMLENCFDRISGIISKIDFYKEENAIIFDAICTLEQKHIPIDIITVVNQLKRLGKLDLVGGPYYISTLTNKVGTSANIEHHAYIVKEKSVARALINLANDLLKSAYDETTDILKLCEDTENSISQVVSVNMTDVSIKGRIVVARNEIYNAMHTKTGVSGISSGYQTIDNVTGGWQNGDLVVLGGAPGSFKTALTLNILHNAAKKGIPVALFEQEMNKKQVGIREIAITTGLEVNRLTRGRISETEFSYMENKIDELLSLPVYVDDVSGISISSFRSKLKKMINQYGIKLCAIDYLQLMDMGIGKHKGNMVQALDETVKEIKLIARSFNIPIILLSQMSRESNKSWKKPPTIFDLKGSGGIEANSDLVIMTWNPNKHSLEEEGINFMYGETDTCNKLGLIYGKQRQGDTGISWLNCFAGSNTFGDMNNVSAQKSISAENDVF